MPSLNIAALARAQGIRKSKALRPIIPTRAQAIDLSTLIVPAADVWAEAKASILAGYVLPTQDGLTIDGANDIQSAIDRAASEFQRILITITPALRRWTLRLERWHRDKWTSAVRAATNVSLATVLTSQPVEETLYAFIARNVALIKDVSAQTQGKIADIVFRNYQQRTPIAQVAKQIDDAVELGRQRARRIAQDQTQKISAALDRERREEAGITRYMWKHSGKVHFRPEHKARDGQIFDNGEWGDDEPGMAPFCGCRGQAYIDLMGEI